MVRGMNCSGFMVCTALSLVHTDVTFFFVISAFQRVSEIPFSFVQLPSWSHRVPSRVSVTPLVWR